MFFQSNKHAKKLFLMHLEGKSEICEAINENANGAQIRFVALEALIFITISNIYREYCSSISDVTKEKSLKKYEIFVKNSLFEKVGENNLLWIGSLNKTQNDWRQNLDSLIQKVDDNYKDIFYRYIINEFDSLEMTCYSKKSMNDRLEDIIISSIGKVSRL